MGSGRRPVVLFVCVHNAGRSQMAAAYLARLAGDRVEVLSAGSDPAELVNPVAVEAMAEVGIDVSREKPELLRDAAVREADVVITMGCADACPIYPGKRYEDWDLPDPAGRPLAAVRPIRDEIEARVRSLVSSLGSPSPLNRSPATSYPASSISPPRPEPRPGRRRAAGP
jgi:arsenate reductase